jgi:hypothetical protein
MKANPFSPDVDQKATKVKNPNAVTGLKQNQPALAPSPEAVARRAYAIYENQGSQPGHEVKHWLEAEAQLFGGVERESQMHPGSSLFTTEH